MTAIKNGATIFSIKMSDNAKKIENDINEGCIFLALVTKKSPLYSYGTGTLSLKLRNDGSKCMRE